MTYSIVNSEKIIGRNIEVIGAALDRLSMTPKCGCIKARLMRQELLKESTKWFLKNIFLL